MGMRIYLRISFFNRKEAETMRETFQVRDTVLTVLVPKELDHHTAEEIRIGADKILERENIKDIRFDFRNTEFMDSSGIGVIMGRYKNIRLVGGRVSAAYVNERVEKIMRMSGLLKFITVEQERSWDAPDRKGGSYGTHE